MSAATRGGRAADVIRRRMPLVLYGACSVVLFAIRGVPIDREQVVLWLGGAVAFAHLGRARALVTFVRDWAPLLAVLLVYDYSRGLADQVGAPVHVVPPIEADRMLFGGTVPTLWLQRHLAGSGAVLDVGVALVYASHFVVPFLVAAVLWVRDRPAWRAYVGRLVGLSFVGLLGYVVYPAAPPWLASQVGALPPVGRLSARGWAVLELHPAERLLERGQETVNLVAAIPSLHAAYAMLVAVFLYRRTERPWPRVALASYPVAMGFVLVYSGEHYVVDVLAGWLCVALVIGAAALWRRRASAPVSLDDAVDGARRRPT